MKNLLYLVVVALFAGASFILTSSNSAVMTNIVSTSSNANTEAWPWEEWEEEADEDEHEEERTALY